MPDRIDLSEYDSDLVVWVGIGGRRRSVPVWRFIEKFLWVEDENGRKVRFSIRAEQAELYRELCLQKRAGEPMRIDVLKARQIGFSTFIAALIFSMCLFRPGAKAAIVADIAEHASNLFRKYRFYYDCLPDEIKPKLIASNAKELVMMHANGQTSSIRIMVQGDSAGRSGTYQYLHLSECAFWGDLGRTLVSLLQTVSSANPDSMVFFETTGNGYNEYKRRWDMDAAGGTPYKALFYPWWTHDAYRRDPRKLGQLMEHEIALRENLGLDDRQIAFYREKWLEMSGDLDMLRQEFPSTPTEAFVSTGNSVFPLDLINEAKERALANPPLMRGRWTYSKRYSEDGGAVSLEGAAFRESRDGAWKVYEDPKPGHPYVINLDPAMGGEDYYAAHVIDNSNLRQCATFHAQRCDDDDVAFQLALMSRRYNGAMVSAECNNPNGSYILGLCSKCGIREIYQDSDFESLTERWQDRFGYKTKQSNKNVMVTLLKLAFRDDPGIVRDYETLCEMEGFEVHRSETALAKERFQAMSGTHDDLVMALCGALYVRTAQSCVIGDSAESRGIEGDSLPPELREAKRTAIREDWQIWD